MVFFIGFLIIHGVIAIMGGNNYKLYSGLDFRTNACGLGGLERLKYMYFPLPNVNVNVTMCIDKCPVDTGRRICLYQPNGKTFHEGDNFCYTSIQTQQDGRYCIPREAKTKDTVDTWVYSWENVYRRALGDLALTADLVVIAYLVELIVLILTLVLLSYNKTIGCCVWLSILICINALNLMALFCYIEYKKTIQRRCFNGKDVNKCGGARASLFWLLIFVFAGMGITYFVIVLYFCRKLQYILNALKASLFLFKRMRQNKLNIMVGTIFVIVFTIFMLLSVVSAASYGPDIKIPAEGISGRFIK